MVKITKEKQEKRKRKQVTTEGREFLQTGRISDKDRLELAKARAGETTPLKEQILKEGRVTTPREEVKGKIGEAPSELGLEIPGQEPLKPEGIETIETPTQEVGPDGKPLLGGGVSSAEGLVQDVALLATGGLGFKVGGKLVAGSAKKVVQAGIAAKNAAAAKPLLSQIAGYSIGAYALLKTGEGLVSYFTGRKMDEQQQALNTLGQITSSIVGDSKTSAGDFDKGLQELRFIRNEVLRLESAIKSGTIQNAAIKFNGKIFDINADIADQLATINEGIRDLQDFALVGKFPELSEFELQGLLRELETEGTIKPVDLTTARRATDE